METAITIAVWEEYARIAKMSANNSPVPMEPTVPRALIVVLDAVMRISAKMGITAKDRMHF